jgi:tetratricopeptide (TPR) repeat protein
MPVPIPHTSDIRIRVEAMLNELASERDADWRNDAVGSIRRANQALKLARRIGWRQGVGLAQLQIARRQEPHEAERTLRRALALFRKLEDRVGEAMTLNNLALIYRHEGQNTLAIHFLATAYRFIRELNEAPALDHAMLLLNLTVASFEYSSSHAALIIAEETIDFCRHYHLDEFLVHALQTSGRALWRQQLDQLALQYAKQALDSSGAEPAMMSERAQTEAAYAGITLDMHNNRESREHGLHAAGLFGQLQNDYERAIALLAIGIASLRLEQSDEARRYLDEILALGSSVGSEYVRACALNVLGDLCIGSGEPASGMVHAEEALAIGERHDDRLVQGLAHAVLYRGAKALGDSARSLNHLEHALRLARDIITIDGDIRFSDLPIQRELEELWRQQAIFRMALPVERS